MVLFRRALSARSTSVLTRPAALSSAARPRIGSVILSPSSLSKRPRSPARCAFGLSMPVVPQPCQNGLDTAPALDMGHGQIRKLVRKLAQNSDRNHAAGTRAVAGQAKESFHGR